MRCARVLEVVEAEHLATCADCQAARVVPGGAPLESLKALALAELKESPRGVPWFAGAIGFTAVTAFAAGLSMQMMPASTTQHASANLQQVSAAAWAMAMLAGCALAVMPAAALARRALFVGLGLCFALTLVAASGVGPPGFGSIGCALTESAIALIPLGVGLFVLTGFAFDVTRALAAGVAAMSGGMLTVHMHCPNGTLAHQVAFHLLPILVLAAVALALRSRLPSRTHAP